MALLAARLPDRALRLVAPGLLALFLASCGGRTTAATTATMPVTRGTLTQQVSGSGLLQPAQESYLNFVTNGTVASVKVIEGQQVKRGEVLASLDTADLDLQIRQAEANLKSAQANLAGIGDGPEEADVRSAQAQLDAAEIQLAQASNGNARAADIASAQAQLASARAQLEALRNPNASDRRAIEIQLAEAQTGLQKTRDSAANAKTNAELALQQASTALTQAQTDYSAAYWDWKWVQDRGTTPGSAGGSLNDFQRQEYYNAYVKAEASLRTAETNVEEARIGLENARKQEIADVQSAEQQLADVQRQLDALLNPDADAIAQAEAQVAQAEAQLDQLTGGGTASDVELARTTVEQRQAALDGLQAAPDAAEQAQAEAQVAQAEAQLAQAQRDRANAELVAPFDGTIATVNLTLGDSSTEGAANNSGEASIYLVDTTSFHVEVNISEVDLSRLEIGQSAQVTFDALPDAMLTGTLSAIALVPTVDQNVTTYAARVDLEPTELSLRVGLSATVNIISAEARDVVLVPNIAIQQTEDGPQVRVQRGEEAVPTLIETGLVGDSATEVRSGLQPGDEVVVSAVVNNGGGFRIPGIGGPPPGGGAPGGGGGAPGGGGSGGSGRN